MRVAAVDIGTNTARLLIADVDGDTVEWVFRRSTVCRLGEQVDHNRKLAPAAMERTLGVLVGYRQEIDEYGVAARGAVATSAMRDAANADTFAQDVASVLGVDLQVISGQREAALSFAGTVGTRSAQLPALVIDPGGGSTEFVWGRREPEWSSSIDIGSVRLTERSFTSRPVSDRDLAVARAHAAELLSDLVPPHAETVFGVGGTFTSLAAIGLGLAEYSADRVDGASLTVNQITQLVGKLASMTVAETAAIPSLDPARADVLLGGCIVAEQAVGAVGVREVTVSERDLLDGLALAVARAGA